jgi:hypothetical protein
MYGREWTCRDCETRFDIGFSVIPYCCPVCMSKELYSGIFKSTTQYKMAILNNIKNRISSVE